MKQCIKSTSIRTRPIWAGACIVVATFAGVSAASAQGSVGGAITYDPRGDWSGPFFGLSLSNIYSEGEAERTRATGDIVQTDVANGLFPGSIGDWQSSTAGGLSLGYNFQHGAFVSGLEFALTAGEQDVDFGFSRVDPEIFVGVNTVTEYGTRINNLSTLSARAGYAMNKMLVFGKVGIARADVRNDFSLDLTETGFVPLLEFSEEGTRWGYTFGGGIEQQIGDKTSLTVEVSYFDLEDTTVKARSGTFFPDDALDYTFQNDGIVTRIGLNFAF